MTTNAEVTESVPIAQPLWLELRWQDGRRVYEFGATDDRVIVVGTQPLADLRIERPDVAPVHLHFERDGRDVCLVPAYHSALTLNAVRVSGITRVHRRAIIEFSGVALDAVVHDQPPTEYDAATDHSVPQLPHGRAYAAALPDEADPTRAVLPLASRVLDPPTTNLAINTAVQSWAVEKPAQSELVAAHDLAPGAASARSEEPIRPSPILTIAAPAPVSPAARALETRALSIERSLPPSAPTSLAGLETRPLFFRTIGLAALSSRPAPGQLAAQARSPMQVASLRTRVAALTRASALNTNTPAVRPPRSVMRPAHHRPGWLAELGLCTKRRPLAVTVAALWSAMILALALTGLNSVVRDRSRASSSQRSGVVQTGRGYGHLAQHGVRASEACSDEPR